MSFDIVITKRLSDRNIALHIQSSDILIAITGASGIGKTTLLNCIAGLVHPDNGHIIIGGECLFDSSKAIDCAPQARGCGYVFQDNRLFPHKSVRANLLFGSPRTEIQTPLIGLEDAVALLGLAHLLDRRPGTLSGGEARRVAIGRALLSAPRFLLLDEPLASLDQRRGDEVLTALEKLRDTLAIPIIHVSHDRAEVTRLTDTIIALD